MSKKRVVNNGTWRPQVHGHRFRLMPLLRHYVKILPELGVQLFNSWRLVEILIVFEVFFTIAIIRHVKYTEIDWSTYMAQVRQIFSGPKFNFNYTQIEGPTGPLVYPAGHSYIFFLLKSLTEDGQNIRSAQNIFAIIYIAQLVLVYLIYSNKRVMKIPPSMFIFLCLTSYRIHSIYVLRLFNDTIAVLFAYASFYALLRKRFSLSAILFSLGVSVKMNILLYAPAYALVFYEEVGLKKSIKNALVALVVQVTLAAPFLYVNPSGYLEGAFNFGRVFLHKWTVNWRFLDEETFTSQKFFQILLAVHIALLLVLFWSRWLKCLLGNKFSFKVRRDDSILTLFIANFIGVICSRSLHYQFYVWYYHSLPMLLSATRYRIVYRILILGCIEYSWNQYPSTTFSSLLLHASHLVILFGLLMRNFKRSPDDSSKSTSAKKSKSKVKKSR